MRERERGENLQDVAADRRRAGGPASLQVPAFMRDDERRHRRILRAERGEGG